MVNSIIKDIKDLQDAKVNIFGQSVILDRKNEYNPNVINLLEALKEYEIDDLEMVEYNSDKEGFDTMEAESIEEYLDFLYDNGNIKELKSDNSYNWSSNIDHDIDFTIYEDMQEGGFLVELKVHRFGDVRVNYTDVCLLRFNSDYEFWEILRESTSVYNTIKVNDKTYYIDIDVFREGYNIYCEETEEEFEIYDYLTTEDDFIKAIKEYEVGKND